MLAFLLVFSCVLTACTPRRGAASSDSSSNPLKGADASGDTRLNVVTTLFPYYDFLRQIAGDSIRLTMVVPAGMDSHSFEPTPADMITIQNADLLVCNGGTMEQWLSQVLDSFEEGTGPKRVVTMMDYVDVVQEEIVEGMEDGEAHDHGHTHVHADGTVHAGDHDHESEDHVHSEKEHDPEDHIHSEDEHDPEDYDHSEEEHDPEDYIHSEDDGHGVEIEYDEHIWTSPVNAKKLVSVLTEVLAEEDPAHADSYAENSASYQDKLMKLDAEFREVVSHAKRRLVVFGDKFPLRYFFDEYGLEYRAAFSGCSTDTEPSAKTIAYLIDKVREEQIPAVYYLELSSPRVAEIIGEETGAEPLLFHSCHNVTRHQFDSGVTYLELMEQNVKNLKKGLS
ncbi:metal ABC transporter solute-binding protein, Zn/Mn family [Clostridium sp.]